MALRIDDVAVSCVFVRTYDLLLHCQQQKMAHF